jgi:hypothetical protein
MFEFLLQFFAGNLSNHMDPPPSSRSIRIDEQEFIRVLDLLGSSQRLSWHLPHLLPAFADRLRFVPGEKGLNPHFSRG